MIPTILIDAASASSTRHSQPSTEPGAEAAEIFGDVFALSEPQVGDSPVQTAVLTIGTADGLLTVADDPTLSEPLAEAPLPAPTRTASLPTVDIQVKPIRLVTMQSPQDSQNPDATTDLADANTPATAKENAGVSRSSVAQSVIEGRLPLPPAATPVSAAAARADLAKPVPLAVPENEHAKPGISATQTTPSPVQAALPVVAKGVTHPARPETDKHDRKQHAQESQTPRGTTATVPVALPATMALIANQPFAAAAMKQAAQSETPAKSLDGEMSASLGGVERGAATTQTASVATGAMAAETARSVAQQIAVTVTQAPGQATEIGLNPEELGRVRLSLTAIDGAITLTVLADRPETQELLRRHLDALAQEFRALGYESIAFSFGREGQSGDQSGQDSHSEEASLDTIMTDTQALRPHSAPTSGLDLRI